MSKFRKKPVVIDAIKWTGQREKLEAICSDWDSVFTVLSGGLLRVNTLEDGPNGEARHIAEKGDWIIKGIHGEFYPCKPDIFEKTYEAVND